MSRFGNLLNNDPTPAPEPVAEEPVVEVPTAEDDLEEVALESDVSIGEMTKRELEAYGRTVGIELDRRHSRKRLVQELEEYLADS
jgi:hypothetical protein